MSAGFPTGAPGILQRLEWKDEAFVDMILSEITGDRNVRTPEELEAVMKEPRGAAPTRHVWIHESLVDEARRLWEQMVAELR
jgi:hypothetical protein